MIDMAKIAHWLFLASDIGLKSMQSPKRLNKLDGSALSDADIKIDAFLKQQILAYDGNARIQSEESGGEISGQRWLIDALDGTASFFEGLAHWGPVIGKVDKNGQPEFGAMLLPKTGELFSAIKSHGAQLNGKRLPTLTNVQKKGSPVVYVPSKWPFGPSLIKDYKLRNLGSISTHLCHVAAGRAAAAIIPPGWAPWDTVTGEIMLLETKALVWSPCGMGFRGNSPLIVAGQPKEVRKIADILMKQLSIRSGIN